MSITLLLTLLLSISSGPNQKDAVNVLFLDGQSIYHDNWPEVGAALIELIDQELEYNITHLTTPPMNSDLSGFAPEFSDYDLVVSIYDGAPWPTATQTSFEKYMQEGGGLVVVHAANNAFPDWEEYNIMTGLGGWGGRDSRSGPYLYYNDEGKRIEDPSPGTCGDHGPAHAYELRMREKHPITKGLPDRWMHVKDELYQELRGPAKNVTVLATAYASPEYKGSGRHEPMLMAIDYGKGRVFHSALGHDVQAIQGAGFIETFVRGCAWAAREKIDYSKPFGK